MDYTLAMATDQEPKIAPDGVQEVPLTKARPLLTRLIEQALEDKLDSALTVRGRRRAYLVTPDFYEQAQADADLLSELRKHATKLAAGDKPDVQLQARVIGEALALAERRVADPDATPRKFRSVKVPKGTLDRISGDDS